MIFLLPFRKKKHINNKHPSIIHRLVSSFLTFNNPTRKKEFHISPTSGNVARSITSLRLSYRLYYVVNPERQHAEARQRFYGGSRREVSIRSVTYRLRPPPRCGVTQFSGDDALVKRAS